MAITLPVGSEEKFSGLIDLIDQKMLRFDEGSMGQIVTEEPIPEALSGESSAARMTLLEKFSSTFLATFGQEIYQEANLLLHGIKILSQNTT